MVTQLAKTMKLKKSQSLLANAVLSLQHHLGLQVQRGIGYENVDTRRRTVVVFVGEPMWEMVQPCLQAACSSSLVKAKTTRYLFGSVGRLKKFIQEDFFEVSFPARERICKLFVEDAHPLEFCYNKTTSCLRICFSFSVHDEDGNIVLRPGQPVPNA